MKCYNCNSSKTVKNGKSAKGKQRYKCKKCNKIIVENRSYKLITKEENLLIEKLYSEGVGINSIGRIIGKSHQGISANLKKN